MVFYTVLRSTILDRDSRQLIYSASQLSSFYNFQVPITLISKRLRLQDVFLSTGKVNNRSDHLELFRRKTILKKAIPKTTCDEVFLARLRVYNRFEMFKV